MRPCMEMILRGLFGLIGVRHIHHVLTTTLIGGQEYLKIQQVFVFACVQILHPEYRVNPP
jgi:hypothetical protein